MVYVIFILTCTSILFYIGNAHFSSSFAECPGTCYCLDVYVACQNFKQIPNSLPHFTERLDLSNNTLRNLTSEPLKHLTQLRKLELDNNLFSFIPVLERLTQLRHLKIASNKIASINPEAIEALPHLEHLDLTGNRIRHLTANSFPQGNTITVLNLNHNRLKDIDVEAFYNLSKLTELKMNRNRINELPKNLFRNQTRLKILEINRNQLDAIDGLTFKSLEHLTTLTLKKNKIKHLMDGAFYGLKNIIVLELDDNSLTKVSKRWLYGLETLTTLSLSGNLISVIEPDAWDICTHLKKLDLSNNGLFEIGRDTFKQLSYLLRLDLNDNQISVIADGAFNNTAKLQYLDLSNNRVSSTIEDMMGGFSGLKKLLRLTLIGNQIKAINRLAFAGLETLTSLDLDKNNITSIQDNAFDSMPALQDLVMNTSSLLCDCNLQWFSNWLRETKFLKIGARCAYPHHLRGKSLLQLSQANFTCGDSPKPYLIEGPETKMTLKGDNVTLKCRARSNSPNLMMFKWKHDNVDIIGKSTITPQSKVDAEGNQNEATSELFLFNMTHDDVGKYQCVVENGFGTTYSSKAYISVLIYPSFTKFPKNISVSAGDTAKLECGAHGQPTPSIAWQKDGGHDFPAARERRMHVMPTDDEFFIINAKHDDTGIYSCIANNSAGVIIANATLTVLERPSFSKPMEDRDVMVGGNIVLQCMAGGMPRPTVSWSKDGGPLSNTERYFFTAEDQLLVIVNIRMTDAGKYECKLSNGLGTVRGYTQLIVLPAPATVIRNSDMMGVIIISVVCCAVGTSVVWVVIIYQTRKRINRNALAVQQSALEPHLNVSEHAHQPRANNSGLNAPPISVVPHTTCVYTDNVSEHSSCKDSGMGDSAKRSSDDFLPVDDYAAPTESLNNQVSPAHYDEVNTQLVASSEEPLLQQQSTTPNRSTIRCTNHERLSQVIVTSPSIEISNKHI